MLICELGLFFACTPCREERERGRKIFQRLTGKTILLYLLIHQQRTEEWTFIFLSMNASFLIFFFFFSVFWLVDIFVILFFFFFFFSFLIPFCESVITQPYKYIFLFQFANCSIFYSSIISFWCSVGHRWRRPRWIAVSGELAQLPFKNDIDVSG